MSRKKPDMSRDFRLYLEDVEVACEKIIRFTTGLSASQFAEDEKTLDAVVRNLAVIGEAEKVFPLKCVNNMTMFPGARLPDFSEND